MLEINLEFIRGMLFVRLKGILDNNNYAKLSDCFNDMINDKGMKYFIVNLEELTYIDSRGLQAITDGYCDVLKHNGKLIICGCEDKLYQEKNLLNQIEHTSNELNAFKLINI